MLFEQDWDETLLEQYEKLKGSSKKPIISTYPYGFSFDEEDNPIYKKQSQNYALVLRPHPETPLVEDSAVLRFKAEHQKTEIPVLGSHLAAGFIFADASFIEEVPYDPFLYFHGEEQSLAIRAFTRGWDIYHPNIIPLYHYYKQSNRSYTTHHWHKDIESQRSLSSAYLKARGVKRVTRLLYGDGMRGSIYGLGTIRTLEEYTLFSGIDYKNKTIL